MNRASQLIEQSPTVLLDFDGPICAVFAGYSASSCSAAMLGRAAELGVKLYPADPIDPISVLRSLVGQASVIVREVESTFVGEEIRALQLTKPSTAIPDLLHKLQTAGHRLAIVTNNSGPAVNTFIHQHNLADSVPTIVGRDEHDMRLLKPSPHLLVKALKLLGTAPSQAVFVGDSVSDIEAARAASVRSIGYANKPTKANRLRLSGADAIITSMTALV